MTNASEQKPAALLRVVQHPIVRLTVLGGTLFVMMAVSSGYVSNFKSAPLLAIAAAAGMSALALAVYVCYGRYVEQRAVSELALHGMGRELGIGLAVGAGLYTLSVLVLMVLGIYRIDGFNPWMFLLPAIAMALSSGIFEELLFRGVLFRSVEDLFGSWISLLVSSFVFGFMHLMNPAATLMGALFISIEAGLLLAAGYMVTRRLWMSIGFHMSWNYTQSGIFSGIVSGGESAPGLIRPTISGPDILTGGSFGLESSVIAFLLCTATGLVLLIMAIRRGNIVPPVWKRHG